MRFSPVKWLMLCAASLAMTEGAQAQSASFDPLTMLLSVPSLQLDNGGALTDVQLRIRNVALAPTPSAPDAFKQTAFSSQDGTLRLTALTIPACSGQLAATVNNLALKLLDVDLLAAKSQGQSLVPAKPTPASRFNLSGWKLQLPVDDCGGSGGANNTRWAATSIATDTLLSGFTNDYFFVDGNALVFRAPANGAATSPGSGSNSTRAELREMNDPNGKTTWQGNSGGTLTGTATIVSVASGASYATFAQIFSNEPNNTKPFAALHFRPATGAVEIQYYLINTATDASSPKTLAQNINLNTPINYSLSFDGKQISVTINDTHQDITVDSTWGDLPLYFKLGAYHNAKNINNPAGDQTVVKYSAFAASHPQPVTP